MATVIVDVKLGAEDAAAKAKELAESIKAIKDEQKGLKKSGDENSAAYVQNAQQLRTLQAEQKSYIQLSQAEIGSNNELRAQLAILTSQYNGLSKAERDNTDAGKLITAQIKATSDELKVNESAVGDNRRNVGNYSDALNNARSSLESFIPGLSELNQIYDQSSNALNSLNGIQKAGIVTTGGLSGAMKVLKAALVSTGIGAIVLVLGSLIAYLATTQEGIDKITAVTRPLQAIFQSLLGVLQNLGKSLFEAFNNPKKALDDVYKFVKTNIIPIFTGYFKILQGIATLDFSKAKEGLTEMTSSAVNGAKQVGAFFKEAAAKGSEIDRIQKSIEKNQLAFNRNQIKYNDLVDEQLLKSKDTSLSFKEREKASLEIIRLRKKEGEEEAAIIKLQIQKLALEQSLNDTARSGRQEMIDLEVQLDAAQDKGLEAQKEQMRVISGARKEAHAKAMDQAKELRAAQADADKERVESLRRVADLSLTARQKEISDINFEIDEKIKQYKKYGRTTQALEKERVARLSEARRAFEIEDLAKQQEYFDKLTVQTNKTIDAQVNAIKNEGERKAAQKELSNQRELAEIDKQIKAAALAYAMGEIQQGALLTQLGEERKAIATRQSNELTQIEIDNELKKQVALAQLKFDSAQTPEQELEARQEFLDAKLILDLENAQGNADLISEINTRASLEQDRLDESIMQNKIARFQQFSTAFQTLTNKNSLAGKIAADISARIDAAQQLRNNVLIIQEQVKAIVSQGKLVFPLNIGAIFATLAALGSGIAAAKNLTAMPKGFAKGVIGFNSDGSGNMVSGAGTSTSDSINARLSDGESVINARSTRMFAPILSAINVAGGGRPLAPGFAMATGGIASGGFVSNISDGASSQTELINGIAFALQNAPAPMVDVRDITSAQQRNHRVVANATV